MKKQAFLVIIKQKKGFDFMKYVIILTDGCADIPIAELGNLTPLEKSNTPNMDDFAKNGIAINF